MSGYEDGSAMDELNRELNELLATIPSKKISAAKVNAVSSAILAASRQNASIVAAALERYIEIAPAHAKLAGIYAIDAACRRQKDSKFANALEPNIYNTVLILSGSSLEVQRSTAKVLAEWRKASLFSSQTEALYDLELRFKQDDTNQKPIQVSGTEKYQDTVLRIPPVQNASPLMNHGGYQQGYQQEAPQQFPPPSKSYYGPSQHYGHSSYHTEEDEIAAMPPYQTHSWYQPGPQQPHQKQQLRGGPVQALLKTRLCRSVGTGVPCVYGDKCSFAHSQAELRKPDPRQLAAHRDAQPITTNNSEQNSADNEHNPKWQPHLRKTKLCRYFQSGHCPFGDKCNFAHGQTEVKPFTPPNHSSPSGHPPPNNVGGAPFHSNNNNFSSSIALDQPAYHAPGDGALKRPPPGEISRDLDEWSDTSLEPTDLSSQQALLKRPRLAT
uniref:C3H1-type domain-containing protein n=1 Tax=Aureoumbra lagunensis TaxID=44058 RepID=A0A7S3K2V6_9STRA|mmetsp:Transcript_7612/g.10595  ORF Transcript_7612/g.10595 Transcript_7612/m.10595 type:complete len:440 (+) Transcript_7612:44-1363(+)